MSISANKIFADGFNLLLRDAKQLSKEEAIKIGQQVYFSPDSCSKDKEHVWRYVANGSCAICARRRLADIRHQASSAANPYKDIDPEKRKAIDMRREEKALRDDLSGYDLGD